MLRGNISSAVNLTTPTINVLQAMQLQCSFQNSSLIGLLQLEKKEKEEMMGSQWGKKQPVSHQAILTVNC